MYIKTRRILGHRAIHRAVLEQEQGLYILYAGWTVLQASWRIIYQSKSTPAGHNKRKQGRQRRREEGREGSRREGGREKVEGTEEKRREERKREGKRERSAHVMSTRLRNEY